MTEQKIMEQSALTAEYFIQNAKQYVSKHCSYLSQPEKIKMIEIYVNACLTDQNTMINNPKRQ